MSTHKSTLKTGLDALFNLQNNSQTQASQPDDLMQLIAHDKLIPNPQQPRKSFNETELNKLASSIKYQGIIQPIVVRKINENQYEIVAGERRWRAAKIAGLTEVPVIIKLYDDTATLASALIENIQRYDLNPLEEAQAIAALIQRCALTHAQVAENIGKSRTHVSNLLRLLNLEEEVKTLLRSETLEMGHARALLSLTGELQINTAKKVAEHKLSVRQTEMLVQNLLQEEPTKTVTWAPELEQKAKQWQHDFKKKWAADAKIQFKASGKGQFIIQFNSSEQAQWLLDNLILSEPLMEKD